MNRPNWHSDHPTGCTCVTCEQRKRYLQDGKVGRNKPCPCGSGKKYKKCHGG